MSKSFQGVLGFGGDVDMFSFQGSAGRQVLITFSLVDDYSPSDDVFYQRANLDAEVTLYNSTNGVIRTWTNEFFGVYSGFGSASLPYTVCVFFLSNISSCLGPNIQGSTHAC